MAIAPDGRIFVAEKGGALRVVKNNALLSQPFLTVSVNTASERGLLGVAFDPDFQSNRFVYVYYTTAAAPIHNRVSRFTASSTQSGRGTGRQRTADPRSAHAGRGKSQRWRHSFRKRRQVVRGRGRECRALQCAVAEHAARQAAAHQPQWLDSHGQPLLLADHRHQPRHLGVGPAQSVHLRRGSRLRSNPHQRRRPGCPGRK